MKNYKVVFIDLDGTLIEPIFGNPFPQGIWDMSLKLPVWDCLKTLSPDYLFIISNQGGIELGFQRRDFFNAKFTYVIACLQEYLSKHTKVAGTYCISNNKDNDRRKPNTEMLYEMLRKFEFGSDFDKDTMVMIGDASGKPGDFSDSDKRTAENFGIDYYDVNDFIKEI